MKALTLSLLAVVLAPYQFCASSSENKPPMEDTAPKALWLLSERLEREGDEPARTVTLQQIVQEYPSSRYAWRARNALGLADPEGAPSAEATPDQEKGEVAKASGGETQGAESDSVPEADSAGEQE
jgi:hypothetical protein